MYINQTYDDNVCILSVSRDTIYQCDTRRERIRLWEVCGVISVEFELLHQKFIMEFEDGEISDNSNDMFIAQDEKYENDER